MNIQARPYQATTDAQLWDFFRANKGKTVNPLIVAPTGSGKSILIAMAVKKLVEQWKYRVLVVTHQKELIVQNFEKLKLLAPEIDAGIYSASIGHRNTSNKVIFAGVQSIYNKAEQFGDIHAVIVDECHLIPKSGTGMYNTLIKNLRAITQNTIPLIGYTATPYRLDSGKLHEGEDAIFTDVAHEIDINELLDAGYLSPLTTKSTSIVVDAKGLHSRNGDFVISELEEATEAITEQAIADALPRLMGRKSIIIFCVTVDHANHVANLLDDCEVITGETPQKERDELLERFKTGDLRFLASVNVLTTGFDAPNVDAIIMLRKTQSRGLYIQMLGRGLRIAEGKMNCLVLDYAGNIQEHGMIDAPVSHSEQKKGEGTAPVKVCPNCESFCHASARECPDCGHQFPPPVLSINEKPSEQVLFSRDYEPIRYNVTRCYYAKHYPQSGKKEMMRVDYFDDSGVFPVKILSEYICIYHPLGSFPYLKAMEWCKRRSTTPEEMQIYLTDNEAKDPLEPTVIYVDDREKFLKIVKEVYE